MATDVLNDPDELERLYHEERLSTYGIGDRLGVDQRYVYDKLIEHGIETRPAPKDKPPGYYTKENGCCYWQCQRRSVSVHRLVAVAEYGLDAVKDKHIHHKNGLKWDNRPCNLEPMTAEEHGRLHRYEQLGGDLSEAVCPNCGKEPYRGRHHGMNCYKCDSSSSECEWSGSPLARTKTELCRVNAEIGDSE